MDVWQIVILVLSWAFIITVLLPFVRNDHWVFRIFEYPRYQKFIGSVTVLIAAVALIPFNKFRFPQFTLVLLASCIVYLAYKIFPYTAFNKKEMRSVRSQHIEQQIRLFTANVFQENDRYHTMLEQIRSTDPDIVLLLETDQRWEKAMDKLLATHPHTLKAPLENTYGLLFYSRLPILEGDVKFLVEKDIPSIETIVALPSGQPVKIFGLHPKPPVPDEDSTSTAKDKELMKVALKVKDCDLPAIVMGDLNDVAWSYVTELFRKNSGLLDPRRGRGFYSTFSAFNPIMRFPLDYVFCSSDFGLINMQRMPKNGSDHFAMFSHFEYRPELKVVHDEPEADGEERKEAKEKASS